jgi:DGQHR domain-containing protein
LANKQLPLDSDSETLGHDTDYGSKVSFAARLVIQGRHRFYTLTMPSDVLADTCVVDTREENPDDGFQRVLDSKRAQEIADYIDQGFGTIPCSIVLSAQREANLDYSSRTQVLSFTKKPRAFLILDGQHRVYGFKKAKARLRVPVVIYNGLRKADEARLFIDINTKQRPVPNELLLDIKRMAETETDVEALLRDVFDLFEKDKDSPLFGLMSPSTRSQGKLSRVTFNTALRPIWNTFGESPAEFAYHAISSYLQVWLPHLRKNSAEKNLTNPTLFRAIILLFPATAERVFDRHGEEYTVEHFAGVLEPFFSRVKKADLQRPGGSPVALHETFKRAMESGFSIGRGR